MIDPKKIAELKWVIAHRDEWSDNESESWITPIAELLSERDELIALLREIEWADFKWEVDEEYRRCPFCGGFKQECSPMDKEDIVGHAPGCRLARALADSPPASEG
jgi:hypothetical protein